MSTTIFLYGFSIAAGVVLVAYGLLHESRGKIREPGSSERETGCCGTLYPSPEPVALQFKDEGASVEAPVIESRMPAAAVPEPQDIPLAWHPGSGDSRGVASIRRLFLATFRKNRPEKGEAQPSRVVSAMVLTPKQRKGGQETEEE
ncbi:MAG: hypothetical protein LLF99_14835 [Desulfobacteraceae bacterium]|nr:hypothetical protein [Desulfobacteraceae bacterium]